MLLNEGQQFSSSYMCHVCSKVYCQGATLSRHLKTTHNFEWPSGHSRFRYKLDLDGFYRLQTLRYESIELSEQLNKTKTNIANASSSSPLPPLHFNPSRGEAEEEEEEAQSHSQSDNDFDNKGNIFALASAPTVDEETLSSSSTSASLTLSSMISSRTSSISKKAAVNFDLDNFLNDNFKIKQQVAEIENLESMIMLG